MTGSIPLKLSVDNRAVERPVATSNLTDVAGRVPEFEEAVAVCTDLDVEPGRTLSACGEPALTVSDWATAAFAGVPDFADLSGGVVGPEGFAGAGTERATRSFSSPDVIEILRLVVITAPSALSA
jgi:hypothetical protein